MLNTAPAPVSTAQPISAAASVGTSASIFTSDRRIITVISANAATPT